MVTRSFSLAYEFASTCLAENLPPGLFYHTLEHTRDDVIPALNYLAANEGVTGEPLHLLRTAAWFHDIGFTEQRLNHELFSCKIVSQTLPQFGFTREQIAIINEIIMVTVIPQAPKNILGQIMADADLDVLGREDFIKRNADLRKELAYFGQEFTDLDWYTWQLNFILKHKYFTQTARSLRDAGKSQNLALIQISLGRSG